MTASARPSALTHSTPTSLHATDAELVEACRAGDPASQRALYEAHVDALFRVAFRLSGDFDLASDITQDAFARAFSHLHQYRGTAALRTWLTAIVVSSSGMVMRRVRPLERRSAPLTDRIPLQARADAGSELSAHIAAAIASLSEKLRAVVVMHDVEGFTHVEISAALGIPTGTSKTRLSEARAKLRAKLANHWSDRLL